MASFSRGLAETGYVEGRNVTIEYRWAEGQNDRLPALAADLVRRQVAVIATPGATAATLAAKAATETIPIVFVTGGDPVELGLVRSLNRPGGNLTGVAFLATEVAGKRLELLHELVPAAASIAVLVNPTNRVNAEAQKGENQIAARVLGVRLLILNASSQSDIEAAFATLVRERASGLVISTDSFFTAHRDQIIALAARNACRPLRSSANSPRLAVLWPTDRASLTHGTWRETTPAASSWARSQPICRCSRPRRSSCSSTSRPPRRSVSTVPPTLLARADEVIE